MAGHTPAEKVPSHGTDLWAQTYAYDFLRIAWSEEDFKFFAPSNLRYWLTGVALDECFGYGALIYAPFSGAVVEVYDAWPERNRLHPLLDYLRVVKNSLLFEHGKERRNDSLIPMIGNYLIIKKTDQEVYALFAHLRPASVKVKLGGQVIEGQELAQVGHTGNSTAPHLHFQLMDRMELTKANGILCSFSGYEFYENGAWIPASGSIPEKRQLVRGSLNTALQPTSGRDAAFLG